MCAERPRIPLRPTFRSFAVLASSLLFAPPVLAQNPIVIENQLPGNPSTEWDVSGAGHSSIQGFATEISVDQGATIEFKIATAATDYRIDIYRMGYYGGMGARKVATVQPSATLPQSQPACLTDPATGLTDCGNWAVSASWTVPSNATSGIYFAKLVREDPEDGRSSHIVWVVRDDDGGSEMLFQTSDGTWQAYNRYGGNSLYTGGPGTGPGRAYAVSYNRPVDTRGHEPWDWVFNAEYPMVRWLERNGYDVSYFTNVDCDRLGAEILEHKVFLSIGHDEYWSRGHRDNVAAARDAGVHMAFLSGNEIYWKTRYENSIDVSSTPHRTLVCYKESVSKLDPLANVWTGLWRTGCAFTPPADGCRPENDLSGQISWTNAICGGTACGITVPGEFASMRLWRDTDIAALPPAGSITLPTGTLGYEWNYEQFPDFYPPGRVWYSTTSVGGFTHHLSLYRAPSGALVFGAGTVQWAWGLDDNHTNGPFPPVGGAPPDVRMQQASVNLFAEMGCQPQTIQAGLVQATATGDLIAPTSVITFPSNGANLSSGLVTITGTAADAGGGVVGVVDVSVDGGVTWRRATGRETWSYNWTAPAAAGQVTIMSRAADDFGVAENPGASVTVTIDMVAGSGQPDSIECASQTVLPIPSAPILVVTNSASPNVYGCYLTEILRGEGLNAFQHGELSLIVLEADPLAYLANFELVLLAETPLSPAEETHFRNYVSGGGKLIAMRPDTDLDDLFGVTFSAIRTEQLLQYFAADTTGGPGAGIVGASLQYHGEADDYTLSGGTVYGSLYANATTPSANPAVVINASGGGQAAAFTFDLAKSVVLTRQGNPAWQDTEGDGLGGYRPSDMFRRTNGDNYNDPAKLPIPQADEAQRFLANLINTMVGRPLPRMWYLPNKHKRIVVNTGDGESNSGASLEPPQDAVAARGGFFTQYLREAGITGTTVGMEAGWRAAGHEVGVHMYGGGPQDFATLSAAYASINNALIAKFGHGARTARNHTIDWVGWSEMAEIEAANGTGLDANYYHIPYYLGDPIGANGHFTGSGLPQRFSDENGRLLAIYQLNTQWPDEWFANSGLTATQTFNIVQGMLELAENNDYYAALMNNIHPVRYNGGDITSVWADMMWDYCQANGIPMWTAEMLLDFTEARNRTSFNSMTWNGTALEFDFVTPASGHPLTLMIPSTNGANNLLSLEVNAIPAAYSVRTVKGRGYALVDVNVDSAHVVATYGLDTTPPVITNLMAAPQADGMTTIITWNTSEAADSRVDYGLDPGPLDNSVSHAVPKTSHVITLTGLVQGTTYAFRATSEDAANNSTTEPPTANPAATFTTTTPPCFVDDVAADFDQGTHANTLTGVADDGEVILAPTEGSEFSGAAIPGGWFFNAWTGGGSATVSGGTVTVEQANIGPATSYGSGRSLEFVATFVAGEPNQHVGFGTDFTSTPWAIFSTGATGAQLQARTFDGGAQNNENLGAGFLGAPHRYRVDWNADNTIDFYIDGALVTTHAATIPGTMAPRMSDIAVGPSLVVDWIRMSPYATSGSFTSRVVGFGGASTWNAVNWLSDEPAGTSLSVLVRVGDTATPDGTWSGFTPIASNGDPVGAFTQFIQYRVDLATTDDRETPVLNELTVGCTPGPDGVPPFVVSTDPENGATGVSVDTDITITYNEPINPATFSAVFPAGNAFTTSFQNNNRVVVINPTLPLSGNAFHEVDILPGVEDTQGNATSELVPVLFQTGPESCILETTLADFADGTFQDTEAVSSGDGAVTLTSAGAAQLLNDTFTEPDGPASNWNAIDGTWSITSGEYGFTHPNQYAASVVSGQVLGSFSLEARQKIVSFTNIGSGGFVWHIQNPSEDNWMFGSYMMQWDTRAGTLQNVRVFRWNNNTSLTLIAGVDLADFVLNTWYEFRVEVDGANFEVFVDDVSVLTGSDGTYTSGNLGLVGWYQGVTRFDDVVLSVSTGGFDPSGTYTSNPLDAGEEKDWTGLVATTTEPATTAVSFETRTGADGATWSAWQPLGGGTTIDSPNGRWIQYRSTLTTGNALVAPEVAAVLLQCASLTAQVGVPPEERVVALALDGARPNPSLDGRLVVRFALPSGQPAKLDLIDIAGRRLHTRDVGQLGPGIHSVRMGDAMRLPPGVYLIRLHQMGSVLTRRVIVLQ